MEALLALVVGPLFATGIYLLLQNHLLKLAFGVAVLSNAANLLIFSSGRMTRGTPPLVPVDSAELNVPFANPLPEALILTAIVISFGLLAFVIALTYRVHREFHSLDPDSIGAKSEESGHT